MKQDLENIEVTLTRVLHFFYYGLWNFNEIHGNGIDERELHRISAGRNKIQGGP